MDEEQVYRLLLARLDRAGKPPPVVLESYWRQRITEAQEYIINQGIQLSDSIEDMLLVVDYAAWMIDSRDMSGAMPEWLRYKIKQRWFTGKD